MHEDLQVPNYRTGDPGIELKPGICMAIEPMLTLGSADVQTLADGWTVVTTRRVAGGSLRAHDRRHGERSGDPDDGMNEVDAAAFTGRSIGPDGCRVPLDL